MATRFLGVREAAEGLGVSESTLWRMLRRGDLASVRIGGRRLVPGHALRAAVRPASHSLRADDIPPFTAASPLYRLAGRYRGAARGDGPGARDKHWYGGQGLQPVRRDRVRRDGAGGRAPCVHVRPPLRAVRLRARAAGAAPARRRLKRPPTSPS